MKCDTYLKPRLHEKNLMKFEAGILDKHINLPKKEKEMVFGYRKKCIHIAHQ